ncbi:Exopolysaccharide biosynthesis protein EpsI, predicted pyruvyl transferase [Albimonas donghaensis]|uniref:Exopolysaccharide biosynthesis protein EpsI, predicted pyruvyl transferase n=1 Tax=Albimonas donghaensis TaxID=356660 RepID=A0A1H3G1B6_9RHOB|nr:polysaccharide pyruvyl transferase family protein [Albimonas donghaensis]SDX96438.1 Exopolysaccharide biosynthesis protein EpsI, predicted pyruvyl transferase [Albimonas donghaensis]
MQAPMPAGDMPHPASPPTDRPTVRKSPHFPKFRENLDRMLRGLRGREVVFCPNHGNGGDSLIAVATYQAFRRAGLKYRVVRFDDHDEDLRGKTLIYAGGGNFVKQYAHGERFLRRYYKELDQLIILPHTFQGKEALLADLGDNATLIARERGSLAHLAEHAPRANRKLMHDLAFLLDLDELRRNPWGLPRLEIPRRVDFERMKKDREARAATTFPEGDVIRVFRTDGEKTARPIPPDNVDLPHVFRAGVTPEFLARRVALNFLNALDRYRVIETNRLHVGLAGALLGKKVRLEDNSYGKVAWVHAHSMAGRFPHVKLRPAPGVI